MAVAQATIGDIVKPDERVTAMGYTGAAMGLGFTAGPLIGTLLYGKNIESIGYISAGVLFISLLNIAFFLPKTKKIQPKEHISLKNMIHSQRSVLLLSSILFCIGLTTAGMQTVLGWHLQSLFHFTEKGVAYMF